MKNTEVRLKTTCGMLMRQLFKVSTQLTLLTHKSAFVTE